MARIVIAEDDDHLRMVIALGLQRAGHTVVQAFNGKECMAAIRRSEPDLVITDLVMPEKEGLETIVELRREFPRVRIIAISGGIELSNVTYLAIAAKLGAVHTLAKPFRMDAILDAVNKVMKLK